MNKDSRIYVAGHRGLVGSAVLRLLKERGYTRIETRTSRELDLRDKRQTERFFDWFKPEYVFLCAARVGGIKDNRDNPLEFFLDNMAIEQNVILTAAHSVKKLLFLGSSCIYPRDCPQPIKEEYLLSGRIEPTTEAYALAKIAGIRMCQWLHDLGNNFVSAMPCNIFGIGDSLDPEHSHVIPGLIARMHTAKVHGDREFKIWGTGNAMREVLFADDLAEALLLVMQEYNGREHINTGSGVEYSIKGLAQIIASVVGYNGELVFDATQPEGTPRKILDNSKIFSLGWRPKTHTLEALYKTYADVVKRLA